MKLTYYGTAAAEGWPALYCQCPTCQNARKLKGKDYRTRSQSLVNDDLLLDFPCDTYLHTLNNGLDLSRVTDVLITHPHEDHFYPEDLACRQKWYCPVQPDFMLNVYAGEAAQEVYRRVSEPEYNQSLPEVVTLHTIREFEKLSLKNYTVYPLLADHDKRFTCFIYLIVGADGKTLLYAHDTGYFPEKTWEFLKGFHLDFVSLDCTSGKLEQRTGHMGFSCNVEVKNRLTAEGIAGPETVFVVNHFSHNCKFLSHEEMVETVKPEGFLVSYDGMEVEF